jgi:hypothetical protein
MTKDTFKPISEVIKDMSHDQREELAASVKAVTADLRVEDAALLLTFLLNNPGTKEAVLREVFEYIQKEMKLQIVD